MINEVYVKSRDKGSLCKKLHLSHMIYVLKSHVIDKPCVKPCEENVRSHAEINKACVKSCNQSISKINSHVLQVKKNIYI